MHETRRRPAPARNPASLARRAAVAGAVVALFAPLAVVMAPPVAAQSLRGSSASLDIQNRIALEHDFTWIETPAEVRRFADAGYLVRVRANADFDLHQVSFPYARPQAELFIRRLAAQYRSACGEKLVVTSLTRPQTRQPRNASTRSVHPTGMAIDLRRTNDRACRSWLERVLLDLEGAGVLEATRESYPPHYHIALFPQQYERYVMRRAEAPASAPAAGAQRTAAPATRIAEARETASSEGVVEYRVRRGDSLWGIARRHGVTVDDLVETNDLESPQIQAGQLLRVPTRSR